MKRYRMDEARIPFPGRICQTCGDRGELYLPRRPCPNCRALAIPGLLEQQRHLANDALEAEA
jgi:hypothetical protein